MLELDRVQALIDAILMITVTSNNKTGYTIYMLARENADICSKTHNKIDLLDLNTRDLNS